MNAPTVSATVQPGDTVRVTNPAPGLTFGDYQTGDTAVVVEVDENWLSVKWETRRFEDDTREANRCGLLYHFEVERVEPEPSL